MSTGHRGQESARGRGCSGGRSLREKPRALEELGKAVGVLDLFTVAAAVGRASGAPTEMSKEQAWVWFWREGTGISCRPPRGRGLEWNWVRPASEPVSVGPRAAFWARCVWQGPSGRPHRQPWRPAFPGRPGEAPGTGRVLVGPQEASVLWCGARSKGKRCGSQGACP